MASLIGLIAVDNMFNKYDVYTTSGSIYCYDDTNILRNRFGIKDNTELKKVEDDITTIRQQAMLDSPIKGRFTMNHLCEIHKNLFGDIYTFAGHLRKESIAKGQTVFENPQNIKVKLTKILNTLKQENYLKNSDESIFISRLAYYFAEINYIHPFREGNGRATREFIRLLLLHNGYTVDWSAVNVAKLLDAMEASVYDTFQLIEVLKQCISKKL